MAALALVALPAEASGTDRRNSLFGFGGVLLSKDMLHSIVPFAGGPDGNGLAGLAYQRQFADLFWGLRLGGEVGIAGRFGDSTSAEFWGGVTLAHSGLPVGKLVFSPGLVTGLSVVTAPIGQEIVNASRTGGDPRLLFYLGPEIAVSLASRPNVEFVYRLHHRSGGWRTLGDMYGGSNANTFGIRVHF